MRVNGKNDIPMLRIAIDLMFVRHFCTVHNTNMYLKINTDRHLKFMLTLFQLGVLYIAVYHWQYKTKRTDNELICPLCRVAQETELHFVLCCPVLRALRMQFIPPKFNRLPSPFRLSLLLHPPMKIL